MSTTAPAGRLNQTNIAGEVYKTDAQNFLAAAAIQTAYYGDPATFMFRVSARFF